MYTRLQNNTLLHKNGRWGTRKLENESESKQDLQTLLLNMNNQAKYTPIMIKRGNIFQHYITILAAPCSQNPYPIHCMTYWLRLTYKIPTMEDIKFTIFFLDIQKFLRSISGSS